MSNPTNKEIEILESLYHSAEDVRQRDLAHVAGLSLGMTNALLKRLANKGWITVRKVNNRNIRYAVTPEGMDVIMRRSYRYFRRTIKNVVYYRRAIEELVEEIKEKGYDGLLLIGASDLDFIVEHACRRSELTLLSDDPEESEGTFFLYSEKYIPDDEEQHGTEYLQRLLEAVEG
jgi:DNA-binding MarR family transcriptional regulator